MQGFKTSDVVARRRVTDNEALDLPDDRRNRAERRRTRNPVFEARARRVGMALDRRQRRGWFAGLRDRCREVVRSWWGQRSGRDNDQSRQVGTSL